MDGTFRPITLVSKKDRGYLWFLSINTDLIRWNFWAMGHLKFSDFQESEWSYHFLCLYYLRHSEQNEGTQALLSQSYHAHGRSRSR